MNIDEVVRRLRALVAMPREQRPVSIFMFERIAGVSKGTVYDIARKGAMLDSTRRRFERALTWLENGQLNVKVPPLVERRRTSKRTEITVGAPKPPQITIRVVRFTPGGPKIRTVAYNPLAFPKIPEREES